MVKLTIQTNGTRKDVFVQTGDTVQSIIAENKIDTTNATVMIGGRVANPADTIADLGFTDGDNPFMNITVKSTNNADGVTVTYVNNVFTVTTCLKKEVIENAYGLLVAKDDKGNDVFAVDVNKHGKAKIQKDYFVGNTYTKDGYLAAVEIFPMDMKEEEVKKFFADALLAAEKYLPQIAKEIAEKSAKVENIFGGTTEVVTAEEAETPVEE